MNSRKKKKSSGIAKRTAASDRSVQRPQAGGRPSANAAQSARSAPRQPAKKMTPEQRRKTNQAYKNATVQRNVRSRRRGSRGGNYVMYYILAAAVIVTVLIVLSNTVLFNCTAIEVEGNYISEGTEEQDTEKQNAKKNNITAQSGIEIGQNLLHIDTEAAQQRILAADPYIDEVEVQKSFPTTIKITVHKAEKWFQVSSGGVNAAVSRLGRIVELGSTPGLPVIEGYDPAELSPGKTLTSEEEGKTSIPSQLLESAEKNGITDISLIDMTDRFDISIDCGDNITLLIGGAADIDVKFAEAAKVIEQEQANAVIDLRTDEKIFVRDKNSQEQVLPNLEETHEQTSEAVTEQASSEG